MTDAPNTEVSYMYRDASNYKQNTAVVFAGRLSAQELVSILANLDGREFFIPSQVGLEDLQDRFGRSYDDDHVWHEIGAEDFQPTWASPTEDRDVHAFAAAMISAEWDVDAAMSEHGYDLNQAHESYDMLPAAARTVVDEVVSELHIARAHGQVAEAADYAADAVARLIRTFPGIATVARATIADEETPA